MSSNSIHVAGTRMPPNWLGLCGECEADLDRGRPHYPECSQSDEAKVAREVAATNQERQAPDYDARGPATETTQCDECGRYGHWGDECARFYQALNAEVLAIMETTYRVYECEDGNRIVRAAECESEALARSVMITLQAEFPGHEFCLTRETIEVLATVRGAK